MSLVTGTKKTAISVRKDPNIPTKPGIRIQPSVVVNVPPQIRYSPSFNPNGTISTPNLLDLARRITNNWFPPDNFTNRALPAGNLVVDGQAVGQLDIAVIPGQDITPDNGDINSILFSPRKDIASAWILVKGNLSLTSLSIIPSQRKLFTVVYITGNLVFNDNRCAISMKARGANHSGTGDSGGATTAADIKVGPNTTIAAIGGMGATPNTTSFSANQGMSGSGNQLALQTGGGGGGWNDYVGLSSATIAQGGTGTCFSGGAGSGGSANPGDGSLTGPGGENGGAGGSDIIVGDFPGQSAAGAGNPDGENGVFAAGTGGTLIVIVEGNITPFDDRTPCFTADGVNGLSMGQPVNDPSISPFGGSSGGGCIVVACQDTSSLTKATSTFGGVSTLGQNGGNGDAVVCTLSAL